MNRLKLIKAAYTDVDKKKKYTLKYLPLELPVPSDMFYHEDEIEIMMRNFIEDESMFADQMNMLMEYKEAWESHPDPDTSKYARVYECAHFHLEDLLKDHTRFTLELEEILRDYKNTIRNSVVRWTDAIVGTFETYFNHARRFFDYSENLLRVDNIYGRGMNNELFQDAIKKMDTVVQAGCPERKKWTFRRLLPLPVLRMHHYNAVILNLWERMNQDARTSSRLPSEHPSVLDWCESWSLRFTDYVKCINQIYMDTMDLLELEKLQNRIQDLPYQLTPRPTEEERYGFKRTDLRHYGNMLIKGEVIVEDDSDPGEEAEVGLFRTRYVVLMEELILVCTAPQQIARDTAHKPFKYRYCIELMGVDIGDPEKARQGFPGGFSQLKLTLKGRMKWKGKITLIGHNDTIKDWLAAFQHLQKYHTLRENANQGGKYDFRAVSVRPGTSCSLETCEEMFRGTFSQAVMCMKKGQQNRCAYHIKCAAQAKECTSANDTILFTTLDPWDSGSTGRIDMVHILPQLYEGSFAFHGLDDADIPGQTFYLSIAMPMWIDGEKSDLLMTVEHPVRIAPAAEGGGYQVLSLPLRLPRPLRLTDCGELRDIVNRFKDNTTADLGTKQNSYKGPLRLPWWEAIGRRQREKGAQFFDWMQPKIDVAVLVKFKFSAW